MILISVHLVLLLLTVFVTVGFTSRGIISFALERKITCEGLGFQMAGPNESRRTVLTIPLAVSISQIAHAGSTPLHTSCNNLVAEM